MKHIVVSDVRCHKGDSAFLLDDGTTSILYDTGFGFTGMRVGENVRAILGERKLDYIFLSHSHYDHALGSACLLRFYPEAKVVACRYAAGIFQREGAKRIMKDLDQKFAIACGIKDYEFPGDELRVDIPCDDGDIIHAGNLTFEVLNLPGHTNCSVAYYCEEKKLLLSSETLGVYDGNDVIVPSFLVSYDSTLNSIDRVLKMDIRYLVSPHLGLLDEQQTRFFLNNMKPVVEQLADNMLKKIQEGRTNEEMLEDFKQHFWHGYIKEIYPLDAVNLNTSIMINLLRKKLDINKEYGGEMK